MPGSDIVPTGLPREPRAWIVANPEAGGTRRAEGFRAAAGALAQSGWQVGWRWTAGPGDAERIAAEAAATGVDVVVVAGGDGTVHEAANGLVGTRCALALLPGGTGNVLAAQLGLVPVPTPLFTPDPVAAADRLAEGRVVAVDVGHARARGRPARHFVLWAGVGLDAEIVRRVESEGKALKRAVGPAAYAALGVPSLVGASGTPAIVRHDGVRLRAPVLMAVVANIPLYAGSVRLAPGARMDDGALDLATFSGAGAAAVVRHLIRLVAGRGGARGGPARARVRAVQIVSQDPLPVHLDAEPFGRTPLRVWVRPRSLRLVVPSSAPDGFLDRAGTDGP